MAKGIKRGIAIARRNVSVLIRAHAAGGSIARALASEGYNGGYRDALDDVVLALNGIMPMRESFWRDDDEIALRKRRRNERG